MPEDGEKTLTDAQLAQKPHDFHIQEGSPR
jgi:hypothetical protein